MPIYELACEGGHRSETLQASTAPLPACPACGGATRKVPSGFGVAGRPPCPRPPSACPRPGRAPTGATATTSPTCAGRPMPAATWRPATPSWPATSRPDPRPRGPVRGSSPLRAGDPRRPADRRGRSGRGGVGDLTTELAAALRRAGVAEVDASARRRAEYSTDASLYRVPPELVAFPRDPDEVVAVVATCLELGVPLTARGAGTSIAGNAVGPGVVMDLARHLGRVLALDPEAATATVEPGVVLDDLQAAARPHGLRFGPDPSTHSRCTLGGMIGNNACGSRALAYGRTADNVLELEVVCGTGQRLRAGPGTVRGRARAWRRWSGPTWPPSGPSSAASPARTPATAGAPAPRAGRRPGPGPGRQRGHPGRGPGGHRPAGPGAGGGRAGRARLPGHGHGGRRRRHGPAPSAGGRRGHRRPHHRGGPAPGPGRAGAARRGRLAAGRAGRRDRGRGRGGRRPAGRRGRGRRAGQPGPDRPGPGGRHLAHPRGRGRVRRAQPGRGAGLGRLGGRGRPARAARRLPARLRGPAGRHGLGGIPYGHFGDGCLHVRIDFPFDRPDGQAVYRSFVEQAAELVAAYGGSMSGEHGDGRARSELLPRMYSPAAIEAMAAVKAVLDPRDLLNPGVLVRPRPFDADLRRTMARPVTGRLGFRYAAGRRRPDQRRAPLHRDRALRGRRHRRRRGDVPVLAGHPGREGHHQGAQPGAPGGGQRHPGPRPGLTRGPRGARPLPGLQGLRLRLPDRGRHGHLQGRGPPPDLPGPPPPRRPLQPRLAAPLGGRRLPGARAWPTSCWPPRRWPRSPGGSAGSTPAAPSRGSPPGPCAPGGAAARPAGPDPAPAPGCCCGRTPSPTTSRPRRDRPPSGSWRPPATGSTCPTSPCAAASPGSPPASSTPPNASCAAPSTGSRPWSRGARPGRVAAGGPRARTDARAGGRARCWSGWSRRAWRCCGTTRWPCSGPDDPAAAAVARAASTLAEVLAATPGMGAARPVRASVVVAQPHCHQHAVLGWAADRDLLARAGAEVTAVGGCCGLAGNFGAERGHYDVSVAVAETALLPAVRAAGPRCPQPRGRAGTVVPGGAAARRARPARAGRPGGRGRGPGGGDPGRGAGGRARVGPARPLRRGRGGPAPLPRARRPRLGGRPRPAGPGRGRGHRRRRLLRAGRQLRRRARPPRRLGRRGRDRPPPGRAGRRPGRGRPGRRVLLPDPARPPGRPPGPPPGRAPRPGQRRP